MNSRLCSFVALFCFAWAAVGAEGPGLRSGAFDPPRMAPEFSLRGSDGSQVTLSRYRGKVVALGFGYTHCPGVCPTTLAFLAEARKKLGAPGKELQIVYVTVDPERDTAEHLRTFLASFDPTFVGATGTPAQLAEVRKEYGVSVSDKMFVAGQSKANYFLDHSSFVYLIDRAGKLRAMMPFGVSVDDIEHDAQVLLRR